MRDADADQHATHQSRNQRRTICPISVNLLSWINKLLSFKRFRYGMLRTSWLMVARSSNVMRCVPCAQISVTLADRSLKMMKSLSTWVIGGRSLDWASQCAITPAWSSLTESGPWWYSAVPEEWTSSPHSGTTLSIIRSMASLCVTGKIFRSPTSGVPTTTFSTAPRKSKLLTILWCTPDDFSRSYRCTVPMPRNFAMCDSGDMSSLFFISSTMRILWKIRQMLDIGELLHTGISPFMIAMYLVCDVYWLQRQRKVDDKPAPVEWNFFAVISFTKEYPTTKRNQHSVW